MKSSWTGFRSPLASGIDAFLAHKRALGCLFRVEDLSLRLFDRFLIEQQIATLAAITPDVVDGFLASRPRHAPRSYNHLRGTLVRLFEWLTAHDRFGPSPVRGRPRRSTRARLPFLFDDDTARRLLDIAGQLSDKGGTVSRGPTYRVIFTLLYGAGATGRRGGAVDGRRRRFNPRSVGHPTDQVLQEPSCTVWVPHPDRLARSSHSARASVGHGVARGAALLAPRQSARQRGHDQSNLPPSRAAARARDSRGDRGAAPA